MGNGNICGVGFKGKSPKIVKGNKEINLDSFKKHLMNIDLEFCKNNNLGPLFLKEENHIKYKKIFDSISKKRETNLNILTQDPFGKIRFNVEEIYSYEFLFEIKLNYVDNNKFSNLINHFSLHPQNELRIIFYLFALEIKGELFSFKNSKTNSSSLLLLKNIQKSEEKEDELTKRCINCDIPRTFPKENISKNEEFKKNLFNILLDISIIDKKLGYVQGMNFIASFLLILSGNSKELCKTLLLSLLHKKSNLFPNLLLKDLFSNGFPLLKKYIVTFDSALKKNLPKIHKILQQCDFDYFMWFSKYLQTIFTLDFGLYSARRFFDILIFNSIDYFILISFGIVDFYKEKLRKCKSLEQINSEFDEIYGDFKKENTNFNEKFFTFLHLKLKSKKYLDMVK